MHYGFPGGNIQKFNLKINLFIGLMVTFTSETGETGCLMDMESSNMEQMVIKRLVRFYQLLTSLKAKKEKGTLDSMRGDSELDMGHIITLMEDHLLGPSLMTRERVLVSCITPRGSGERAPGSWTSCSGR